MKPFKTLNTKAAPLNMMNVDTDIIIPKRTMGDFRHGYTMYYRALLCRHLL